MILQKEWKRNAVNGPGCDTGECTYELITFKQNRGLLLGISYFSGAEFCVYYNQDPKWTNQDPHSSLGLGALSKEQIYSIVRAASGQAIETLHIMRTDSVIHQYSHRTGAGSREQSLDALVGSMKWRQPWTCRVVSGKLLNCCFCCLWSCGRVRFSVSLFVLELLPL